MIMKGLPKRVRHCFWTQKKALQTRSGVSADSVICYNTTGYVRSDYVLVPYAEGITEDSGFRDERGMLDACAVKGGILVYVEDIPAYGYKTIEICKKDTNAINAVTVDGPVVKSPYWHWN